MGNTTTNFQALGTDIGLTLVDKSYVIDRYPELVDSFKQAGLWAWGYNNYGQLGDNTTINKSSPVQTIAGGTNWKQVAGGYNHKAAIKTDGTLWTFGASYFGQLGNNIAGLNTNKSSPVQTVAGGTNWKQVSCGRYHTAAIKTDGTLWDWGYNVYGQLGDNTQISKSSPVQTIAGGTNWKQVACGDLHTAAIKTDGTLWSCGYDYYGVLGDNTTTDKASPVQTISAGTNWKQLACGSSHTAAIKTDGTLWAWGLNQYGQLGDNTSLHKSSPVQTIAGGNNWKQVACGEYYTAAIKTDGTLWTFGYNNVGQLGDGTQTTKSSPVQNIAGATNWKQVSCGSSHAAAVKTDGTLWAWGYTYNGLLGDNSNSGSVSVPVQTSAAGTNWKQVACGWGHTSAIRDESSDPLNWSSGL